MVSFAPMPQDPPVDDRIAGRQELVRELLRTLQTSRVPARGDNILICAAPKSASTFFTTVLATLLRVSVVNFATVAEGHVLDHRLGLGPLAYHALGEADTLACHHTIANAETLSLIKRFGLKTIVLSRGILDSLVSLRDHHARDARAGAATPASVDSNCFVHYAPPSYHHRLYALDEADLLDATIDRFTSWYFQFNLSWRAAQEAGVIEAHHVRYERFVEDEVQALASAAAFIGLETNSADLAALIGAQREAAGTTMLNVGRSGRGREILSEAQIQRVRAIGAQFVGGAVVDELL